MYKRNLLYLLIFSTILVLAIAYLFREGFWFFQDAGYWPKNYYEVFRMFQQQFHSFTSDGYYLGFDQGLFNFTRILFVTFTSLLFLIFGYSGSQIVFTIASYVLVFTSFYMFTGLFFTNKNLKFVLGLLYVFNPLSYSLQGHVFFQAIAPLFLFSFHKFFYDEKKIRLSYLLVMILAMHLWVSYIRFLQSNFLVIVPYIIYFFFLHKRQFPFKRVYIFFFSSALLFLPIIFSFVSQILDRSQTAFSYGALFGKFVIKYPTYNAFNLIQSVAPRIYEEPGWSIIGILFFSAVIILILTFPKKEHTGFYYLNLFLVIAGVSFYGLGNFFGKTAYLTLVKVFPFIINEPFWGFYVLSMPIVVFLGILTMHRVKYLYTYASLFIFIALLPLFNLNNFQLQKFDISRIPKPYYEQFIKPYSGIPEGSYYLLGSCWRAEYMNIANTPTLCPNYGYRYSPISFSDPRLATAETAALSEKMSDTTLFNSLKVTHNLKHIFVPNDLVTKNGPGPETGEEEMQKTKIANTVLESSQDFLSSRNMNFTRYSYKDSGNYDFFIYSPAHVSFSESEGMNASSNPVFIRKPTSLTLSDVYQSANVFYKVSKDAPTKYYLKLSNTDLSKPFLLQLNQAFGNNWRIKQITRKEFDNKECIMQPENFPISNNKRCIYEGNSFDYKDLFLVMKPDIKDAKHFNGNYLGNTWLINLNESSLTDEDFYIIVVYAKQIYYTYTIILSLFTLALLILLSIIQEIHRFQTRKIK